MEGLIKFAQYLRKLYWWVIRPTTMGIRAIIINEKEEVLLVKHTYSKDWYLPGGGLGKNETYFDGLKRELKQEVGLRSFEVKQLLGCYTNFFEYKSDHILVFVVYNPQIEPNTHFEISKVKYFSATDLPGDISPGTRRRLDEYFNDTKKSYRW